MRIEYRLRPSQCKVTGIEGHAANTPTDVVVVRGCSICGGAWTKRDGLVVCSDCGHVRWVQDLPIKIAAGTGGRMREGYRNDD